MSVSDPLFMKWENWLAQIHEQQLRDLLINRHIFHQFRDSVNAHPDCIQAPALAEWMLQCYVNSACAGVRKMSQKPKDGYNSVSLGILLADLKTNQPRLSRVAYVEMYGPDWPDRKFADRDFDRIAGAPGGSSFPVAVIDRDIQELKDITRPVKALTDQVIVHTDLNRSKLVVPTYADLDKAIDFLRDTFAKYYFLLTARGYAPVRLDEYDVRDALARLWNV
jgi:hypothetical protein